MSQTETKIWLDEKGEGICSECGTKMKHYRKLDGSFWVHYEICECGRMTNFTRIHVSHKERHAEFKAHLLKFWGMQIK